MNDQQEKQINALLQEDSESLQKLETRIGTSSSDWQNARLNQGMKYISQINQNTVSIIARLQGPETNIETMPNKEDMNGLSLIKLHFIKA